MVITKKQGILEVVQKYPSTVEVFRKYGMGCLGCIAAKNENIEQGAAAHEIDVDLLVADLNKAVNTPGNSHGCGCGCGG